MINRILFAVVAALFMMQQSALAATPKKVEKTMKKAIEVESKAQAKADDWTTDKDDLVNEIRDLQTRLTWLEYQKGKHKVYVKGLQENIAELEAKKLEARKLRENLEPFLDEVVKRLEAFIAQDMPFLPEERQQRLSFLYNTLNDYQLDLGEKLRRVFESLSVEATYGKMVSATNESLNIDGDDTEVTIFRLGRMAMYYQSMDKEKIGRWNPQTKKWNPCQRTFQGSFAMP